MHNLRSLVFILALISFQTYAALPFQPESSIPENGSFAASINKSFIKKVRVKVFPHDLKSDWVHGRPDNPLKLELKGDSFFLNDLPAKSAHIQIASGKLSVRLDDGHTFSAERVYIESEQPVKIVRENNLNKSHAYLGELELFIKNEKIFVVNHIDIETYLKGVVPKESVSSWPLEALKAQAVAARSYAYYHLLTSRGKEYDVDDTARYQVYAGHSARTESTDEAVEQTRGEALTHNSKVIVAFFHAYSGGRTDSALNIFGSPAEFCQGKEEIFSREELIGELKPSNYWIVEWTTDWMNKSSLMSKLKNSSQAGSDFGSYSSSRDFQVSESEFNEEFDSVKTLSFIQEEKKASLDFVSVRKILGWANFPSYHFRLLTKDHQVAFRGNGWGHHVGLSQWGAFIMAKNYAKAYREILHHYYTDVELTSF